MSVANNDFQKIITESAAKFTGKVHGKRCQ